MMDWYVEAIRTLGRIAFRVQRSLARLAMVGAAFLLSAVPSMAGLQVCNETHGTARVALGQIVEADWKSQGWWRILPGKCKMLLSGALKARYYYLFSTDGHSGTWGGSTQFCMTESQKFTIAGRMGCAHRGYDTKGFFEIDTRDRSDWTEYLSD